MKTVLTALLVGAFACTPGLTLAQEKTAEPAKEQLKKAEAKKDGKAEAGKEETRKKVKKGGC